MGRLTHISGMRLLDMLALVASTIYAGVVGSWVLLYSLLCGHYRPPVKWMT